MNNHDFETIINYHFHHKELLEKALTHSSFCRENGVDVKDNNERLEFLGDAFFDAVISVELYKRLEKEDEGYIKYLYGVKDGLKEPFELDLSDLYFKRILSAIIAINSEFVGFPLLLCIV